MTKDVLALALEALELMTTTPVRGLPAAYNKANQAITAIKQAQEPVTGFGKIVGTHGNVVEWPEFAEQAQEPVGYTDNTGMAFAVKWSGVLPPNITLYAASTQAEKVQEPVAWVWNPAKESWEQVRAYGHWQQGAIYAFGPNPAAPKQAEPEGYKLVPVEPTQEMCDAARWSEYGEETSRQYEVSDDFIKSVWDSLLAAAPTPPEAP